MDDFIKNSLFKSKTLKNPCKKKIRKTTTDYADRCGVKSIVMSEVNRKGCLQKRK